MKRILSSLALLALPAAAQAGWHVVQEERAIAGPPGIPKEPITSDIFFEDGKLRIDQGSFATMIYDFAAGRMLMISHQDKQFMSQTLADMAAMKDRLEGQKKKQLEGLPPDVRKKLESQLGKLEGEKAAASKPKKTGKKEKVGKFDCEVYTWQDDQGSGEMCLATNPGVDLASFVKATEDFSKKLEKITGEVGGGGLVEMARLGFPVRSRRKMKMGGNEIETVSEVKQFAAMKVPADKFAVPSGYTERELPPPPAPEGPKVKVK